MWLTFDDINTPDGWMPLIAMVDDVPGVHSVRVDYEREGELEVNSSKRQEAVEAAAAGALVGAAAGVASHNEKDAAMGAAVAAATAYMVASGLGQELALPRDTKIEIILERSLHFGRRLNRLPPISGVFVRSPGGLDAKRMALPLQALRLDFPESAGRFNSGWRQKPNPSKEFSS